MFLLYDLLLLCAAAVLIPVYQLRGIRYGKSRRGVRERLGYFSASQQQQLQERQVIWVHAVSVGETRAAEPLLEQLRIKHPDHLLLLTNVTETGHAMGLKNPHVDCCLFFPFDFSWVVRRVLKTINPDLVVIVETEIWPNFVRQAKMLDIPLVMVNGRISDRSYPRYHRFRFLLQPLLESFSSFCMQSQRDAERIIQLGADSLRVENTGNLKFDHALQSHTDEEVLERKNIYRLRPDLPVLVAGSTHVGEEEQLLQIYRKLLDQDQQLLLILIPRHPERSRELLQVLAEKGFEGRLRSQLDEDLPEMEPGQVLLVDTLGEVLKFYAVADLVFVGGSLVQVGGHNLLEACLLEKPVLFGSHVHNFRAISAKLTRAGAGIRVRNSDELFQQCQLLLNDPIRRRAMGQAGGVLITENTGATERTMRRISRYVKN